MTKKKRYATHVTGAHGERVYISAATKEDFEKKVMEAKMAASAGVELANDTTVKEYIQTWLACYKAPPKTRQLTYDQIKARMDKYIIPGLGHLEIRKVKPFHIHAFVNGLTCGPTIQEKVVSELRNVFNTAVENNLLLKSPVPTTLVTAAAHTEEKEPLTNEEVLHLLDALQGTPAYLFCLIAVSTGMRRGEILGLRWDCVDLDSATIHVLHNRTFDPITNATVDSPLPKTDCGIRDLPIPTSLLWALRGAKAARDSEFVISKNGRGLDSGDFHVLWDQVVRRTVRKGHPKGEYHAPRTFLGKTIPGYTVDFEFHCTPHILRHTYITQLFESGLDIKQVQKLAGHKTPDITMKIYTHYRERSRKEETATQVTKAMDFLATGTCGK